MIMKGLAVAVILLFIGVAFAIPINANVSKSSLEPVSNMEILEEVDSTSVEFELQRIKELINNIDLRKIIINPNTVVDKLEEISNIIEENEDCGCEDDSSDLEWIFPVICTLLVPFWGIAALIVLLSNGLIWQPVEIMAQIGLSLNCYWIN